MKKIAVKVIILLCITTININYGQSQDIRPKNKIKIDSLYPKARLIGWNGPNGITQDVEIKCNCPEFGSYMQLTFDTNANILVKEYFYNSLKYLPDAILNYIKTDTSQTIKVEKRDVRKSINYNGNLTYTIFIYEGETTYRMEFKSNGELLSKKPMPKYKDD